MGASNFKTNLKNLNIKKKIVLIGAFLAVISVVMPWYRDIDRFNTGDTYLGITGPLYLAGIIILLGSASSLGLILLELFEKPRPKLPLKEQHFHIFIACVSALMIVLISSVYFHPRFGMNVANKSMQIGMIFGIIGAAMVLGGGIWMARKAEVDFDVEGKVEPLINLAEQDREKAGIEPRKEPLEELYRKPTFAGTNDSLDHLLNDHDQHYNHDKDDNSSTTNDLFR